MDGLIHIICIKRLHWQGTVADEQDSDKGRRYSKACALTENLWDQQMTSHSCLFIGKEHWALKSGRCGFNSWLFQIGRTSGKFLNLPESFSSSIKWDSYLLGSCDDEIGKDMQSSGPSSLCPHPILPTPEVVVCTALVELWAPNSLESLLGMLLGHSILFLLFLSVFQEASLRSLL